MRKTAADYRREGYGNALKSMLEVLRQCVPGTINQEAFQGTLELALESLVYPDLVLLYLIENRLTKLSDLVSRAEKIKRVAKEVGLTLDEASALADDALDELMNKSVQRSTGNPFARSA